MLLIRNSLLDVNKIHVILASAEEQTIFKRLKYHFNKRNKSGKKLDYYINSIDTADRYDNKITVIIKRLPKLNLIMN